VGMMLPTRRKPTNVIRPICNVYFSNSVDEPERSSSPGLQRFWNSGRGADCFVDDLSGYFAGRFGHERLRDDREMTRNRTVAHLNAALRSVKYSSKVMVHESSSLDKISANEIR